MVKSAPDPLVGVRAATPARTAPGPGLLRVQGSGRRIWRRKPLLPLQGYWPKAFFTVVQGHGCLNKVTGKHGTDVSMSGRHLSPFCQSAPRAAQQGVLASVRGLVALVVASRQRERNQEYRAGADVPGFPEHHIRQGLPAPPFNRGAYSDRQFGRAMAPNRLRPDGSDD